MPGRDAVAALVDAAAADLRLAGPGYPGSRGTTDDTGRMHWTPRAEKAALADRLTILADRLDYLSDVWQVNLSGADNPPDLIEAVGHLLATADPRNDPDPDDA